jgi:hypothetical protein
MMTNLYDDCPVKAPKLIKAYSLVETCAYCGAWVERYPAFLGENDNPWHCEKCYNTSVNIRDGRPYAPKSARWSEVVKRFEELFLDIPYWDWETVVTEPPMKDLDWNAAEEYFNSKGIYRVFIGMGKIAEYDTTE